MNRRYSNGLAFIAAYTWSHLEDDATATNFSTYLTPRRAQDFQDLKADWSASALDRRQRLTFTPIYEFRPFKNGNWLAKNVLGNWNISGTYTFESPEYATVQSNLDSNLNGDSAGDRSIINPAGLANVGTGVTGYNAQGEVATSSGIHCRLCGQQFECALCRRRFRSALPTADGIRFRSTGSITSTSI